MNRIPDNRMLLAGHRGERVNGDENTMPAFERAISYGVDMIETDIHSTLDDKIILMHDHTTDRTTGKSGAICATLFDDIRRLDAGHGACPATLDELLDLACAHPGMMLNLELKDYPEIVGKSRAFETVDRTIEAVLEHELKDLVVLNSFSGTLLSYVAEKYGPTWPLHGFYPYVHLSGDRRNPDDYLFCACIFPLKGGPVPSEEDCAYLASRGIENWANAGIKSKDDLWLSYQRGCRLITSDEPETTLRYLRELGIHD